MMASASDESDIEATDSLKRPLVLGVALLPALIRMVSVEVPIRWIGPIEYWDCCTSVVTSLMPVRYLTVKGASFGPPVNVKLSTYSPSFTMVTVTSEVWPARISTFLISLAPVASYTSTPSVTIVRSGCDAAPAVAGSGNMVSVVPTASEAVSRLRRIVRRADMTPNHRAPPEPLQVARMTDIRLGSVPDG